jgi:hypothetical protein
MEVRKYDPNLNRQKATFDCLTININPSSHNGVIIFIYVQNEMRLFLKTCQTIWDNLSNGCKKMAARDNRTILRNTRNTASVFQDNLMYVPIKVIFLSTQKRVIYFI